MKKIAIPLLISSLLLFSCSRKQQASDPKERQAWHNQALVTAYDTVGRRDPKWDGPARKALSEYAEIRASKDPDSESVSLGDLTKEAVNAGCDDPMIFYLYCRFSEHSSKPLKYWQGEFRKAAQGLESSGYSPLLKFYVNNRTANVVWEDRDQALWPEVTQFRRAAMNNLAAALQDKSLPIDDVAQACDALMDTISANDKEMTDAYNQIETPLFKNWPHASASYFIKGKFYYQFAWTARGGGYSDKVTAEGWEGFRKNLAVAEAAYRKAWSLNPKDGRIPTEMIEMAVCQQKDRAEMELWFQRGMQLNTNNYAACWNKLRYLMPKWYGSPEEMVAFGRECLASQWGGRVPLILVDAHYEIARYLDDKEQDDYWRKPEVWPDIQSAYEKFFDLNPDASSQVRYYYARYAFFCGQWHDFNAQMKIIRDKDGRVDTDFFGGEEKFGKMVEQATAGGPKN